MSRCCAAPPGRSPSPTGARDRDPAPAAPDRTVLSRRHARSREKGGTGLGLAIVKAYHQPPSRPAAHRKRARQGSRFTVILPTRDQRADRDCGVDDRLETVASRLCLPLAEVVAKLFLNPQTQSRAVKSSSGMKSPFFSPIFSHKDLSNGVLPFPSGLALISAKKPMPSANHHATQQHGFQAE